MVQRAIERKRQQLQRRGRSFTGAARRHAANEAVHVAANAIVGLATKNHSQVVIENLSGLASTGGKRRRSRFNRILNRAQYQKLQKVLSYNSPSRCCLRLARCIPAIPHKRVPCAEASQQKTG
jgi:IS605 OrfB family transposase